MAQQQTPRAGQDKTTAPTFPTEKIMGQQNTPEIEPGKKTEDVQPLKPFEVQGQKRAANPKDITPSSTESVKTREDGMQSSDDLDKH